MSETRYVAGNAYEYYSVASSEFYRLYGISYRIITLDEFKKCSLVAARELKECGPRFELEGIVVNNNSDYDELLMIFLARSVKINVSGCDSMMPLFYGYFSRRDQLASGTGFNLRDRGGDLRITAGKFDEMLVDRPLDVYKGLRDYLNGFP